MVVELVIITGLLAGLGLESERPSQANTVTETRSTSSPMSTSQTAQTSSDSATGQSSQNLTAGVLGNASAYYPDGVVFRSPATVWTSPVFLAQANSSATLYVVYDLNETGSLSLKTDTNTTADEPAGTIVGDTTIPTVFDRASPDVSVVPSQGSISRPGAMVSFAITISANASGLYAVYVPHLQCTPLWLAVGYTPAQITGPNFPFTADSGCLWGAAYPPSSTDRGYIIGVEGIQVLYAKFVG
ncbi:MAG: hypothetical protein JRN03_06890 [Nitrososphaerota archaeon]|nr:hypothetical protein [Nitrososphaerota archaeon]